MKGWKKTHHSNNNRKRPAIAILSSDKIGFWTKIVTRDKGGNFIMINGSVHEQDIKLQIWRYLTAEP